MGRGGESPEGSDEAGTAAAAAAEVGAAATAAAVEITFKVDDVVVPPKSHDPAKVKYQCPQCGWAVWGKAGMAMVCGIDAVPFRQMNLPPGMPQQPVPWHPALKIRKDPAVAYWERKKRA